MSSEDRLVVTPRLVVGVCITAIGALLLFDRLGVMDSEVALRFWPAGLITLGAVVIAQSDNDGHGRTSGFVMVGIGTWLLFSSLGVVRLRDHDRAEGDEAGGPEPQSDLGVHHPKPIEEQQRADRGDTHADNESRRHDQAIFRSHRTLPWRSRTWVSAATRARSS